MKTLRISVDQISEYSNLEFGERGENAVTEVILDFSAWVEEFGEGIVNLYVKRGGDTSAYPVPLSVEGTVATWIVSETDTYKKGRGEAEYVYVVGEQVEKTAVFGFYVNRDIGQPATTPPSPYETWLETLMELSNVTLKNAQDAENAAGEAAESAGKAETAASHYPVIVDNYWYVWRVEEEAYVNTGVKAEGEDFTIKGTAATVADLPSEANQGDFWNVGTEAPYTMYMYQVGEGWINQGTLQGPTGTTFTPSVSEEGIISWTNDGGKPNPVARNIRGPQGIQGEKGDTGDAAGFGTPVASADQTIGQASVSVTASGPNTEKVFDFKFSGIKGEQGEVGQTGTTFTPQVSSAGVISWTNDGGKQNPESVNIKGPQGEQGVKGDTGAAAGFGTPTASTTQTIGEAAVEVTATGPDTAKVFDFRFSGIKGEKGDKGDKGDTGEVTQAEFDELAGEVAVQKSAFEDLEALTNRKAGMLVDSVSGAIASFVPDATIDNLLGVTVGIEPVQDLHGYDAPWPAGGGVNKFNGTFLQGYWAYADGSWVGSNNWIATEKIPCKASTSYTVSADAKLTRWQGFVWYDANGNYISTDNLQSNENIGLTRTSPSNAGYLAFNIAGYPNTNSTISPSDVTHFQLEEGSSPTTYAPYSNLCPISGWMGAEIKHSGEDMTVYDTISRTYPETVYSGKDEVTGDGVTSNDDLIIMDGVTNRITGKWGETQYGAALYATGIGLRSLFTNSISSVFKLVNVSYDRMPLWSFWGGSGSPSTVSFVFPAGYTVEDANNWLQAQAQAGNPVQILRKRSTPVSIPLDPATVPAIPGQTNNVWADAGDVTVTYAADLKTYIDSKIAAAVAALS